MSAIDRAKLLSLSPIELAKQSIYGLYAASGLSCIPIAADGSKKTPLSSWHKFGKKLPTKSEMVDWHNLYPDAGVAIIAGVVSGGLEILDFDDGSLMNPWYQTIEHIACRLPIVSTPSNGWHVYYRCEEICGNQKIAVDPSRKKSTLIETRGEGGYVLAPGCSASCHPTGRLYIQELGPVLPDVPIISTDERRELWIAARLFDKRPPYQEAIDCKIKELRRSERPQLIDGDIPPWGDFDARGDWSMILIPSGWSSTDGIHWRRPGKTDGGYSANVNIAKNGQEVLTVFSTNAGPLSPSSGEKSWGKSDAYALLHHGGSNRDSARALRSLGYGGRSSWSK